MICVFQSDNCFFIRAQIQKYIICFITILLTISCTRAAGRNACTQRSFSMDFMNVDAIRSHKVRTILTFSIPAIISMVLTSFITIADGFFMGNFIDKDAIAAVNLGLPIIYLYLATGLMISVGGSVIAGMALGSNDTKRCAGAFNQTMLTTAVIVCALSIVMIFCLSPMLRLLHAEAAVASYFLTYYRIMLLELPVMILSSSFAMFIRAEGNPQFALLTTVIMVVLNIVLDYVFAGPCRFGIQGIAYASLISAIVSLALSVWYFIKKSRVFKFARFVFDRAMFRDTTHKTQMIP